MCIHLKIPPTPQNLTVSCSYLGKVGIYICVFETRFHYIALAVLEITVKTKLALNSQRSTCPYLLKAGIKGVRYHSICVYMHITHIYKCLLSPPPPGIGTKEEARK